MNIIEFRSEMSKALQEALGNDIEIKECEVNKNNGVIRHGLAIISKESNCSPTFYMEEMYQDFIEGTQISDIVSGVVEIYNRTKATENIDIEFFTDYNKAKERLGIKLINYENNKEMLQNMPHRELEDLALVYFCHSEDKRIGKGLIMINNSHMDMWGINEETLFIDAMSSSQKNLPCSIISMNEMMKQMLGDAYDPDLYCENDNMYVVTNSEKTYGASCLCYPGLLKHIAAELGTDFYILPSSVHEVIVVPETGDYDEADSLAGIVKYVNSSVLNKNDFLSDNVYFYNSGINEMNICLISDDTGVKCS